MPTEDLLRADLIDELSAATERRVSVVLVGTSSHVEERARDEIHEAPVSESECLIRHTGDTVTPVVNRKTSVDVFAHRRERVGSGNPVGRRLDQSRRRSECGVGPTTDSGRLGRRRSRHSPDVWLSVVRNTDLPVARDHRTAICRSVTRLITTCLRVKKSTSDYPRGTYVSLPAHARG